MSRKSDKTKPANDDKSVYCIAVIHLKEEIRGACDRVDRYAELVCIDDNIATVVSRRFAVSMDYIDFVSVSFVTKSNSHLGFCGRVTNVILDNNAAVYTIEIPKTKILDLKNGTILEIPNENLIKYKNIHKSKRPQKETERKDEPATPEDTK